jgi:Uma2 family endonuclease
VFDSIIDDLPDDGKRYEIIDGELRVSGPFDVWHQLACAQIGFALGQWDPHAQVGITIPAPGLVLAPDQIVAPDLIWATREHFARIADDADGKLHGAPDLVVEVLSPGRAAERRDREVKLKHYSREGVAEYWIANWKNVTIEVYRREQTALRLVATLAAEDTLASPLLPGFAASVRELCTPPT